MDLGAFLEELAQEWSDRAKEHSLILLKEVSPSLPRIETDESHLKKILHMSAMYTFGALT